MPPNIELRFTSQRFAIEQASLLLGYASLNPQSFEIVNGSVKAFIARPGLVEGALFGPRLRRLSGQGTTLFAWTEFSRQVTEEEWRSGVITINMDTLRELVIRVEDDKGRRVAGVTIGLIRFGREGGMDFKVDGNGEVKLLLFPGTYGARAPGGPPIQFQVTSGNDEQMIRVVPRHPQESTW